MKTTYYQVWILTLSLLLATGVMVHTSQGEPATGTDDAGTTKAAPGAWWIAGQQTSSAPAAATAQAGSARGEGFDLSGYMQTPEFQKQLADSYLSDIDIEPTITVKEREVMVKVMQFISGNQMPEAIDLLQKSLGEQVSAVFDFTLANVHFQREEYDQAAAAYETAVKKFPKFRRAWRNLSLIYVRQNNWEKAIPVLTKVIELGAGEGLTYGLLGFGYATVDNQLAAESAYRMAILLDPKTADWKMGLVRTFYKQERWHDVIALVGKMIAETPDRADLWMLQANAYIGLQQPMRAAENYEIVDNLGKSTVSSLNMLADIYINEGLFGQAVEVYSKAMAMQPDTKPERAVRAARVMLSRGAMDETNRLLDIIDKDYAKTFSDAERKDLLKLRARLAVAKGAGDEEARLLEEIVALDPLDGEALILLGQHNAKSGDRDKAIFFFERAAGMEKFEADAKVRHAQLLVREGKYDQALPLLRRAQQVSPRENIQTYLEQIERVARGR